MDREELTSNEGEQLLTEGMWLFLENTDSTPLQTVSAYYKMLKIVDFVSEKRKPLSFCRFFLNLNKQSMLDSWNAP